MRSMPVARANTSRYCSSMEIEGLVSLSRSCCPSLSIWTSSSANSCSSPDLSLDIAASIRPRTPPPCSLASLFLISLRLVASARRASLWLSRCSLPNSVWKSPMLFRKLLLVITSPTNTVASTVSASLTSYHSLDGTPFTCFGISNRRDPNTSSGTPCCIFSTSVMRIVACRSWGSLKRISPLYAGKAVIISVLVRFLFPASVTAA
mmetsp:Transcript_26926/g.63983  ORF Transcript_26926/g.63983 Transcript_26926/m.63983 type:complete len:206 (+) Transcript_26926:1676-2293(+)